MFKKFLHIAVSLLLLVATTGVNLSLHYSGNKLFSISLTGEAGSCCDTECNCCDESTINFQIKDEFNLSFTEIEIEPTVLDLTQEFFEVSSDLIAAEIFAENQRVHLLKIPDKRPDTRSILQVFLI